MRKEYVYLLIVTLVGGLIRFWSLGVNPIWIDEGIFAHYCRDCMYLQEYTTVWLVRTLGLYGNEFNLRFIFALAGTLTIPAVYFVTKYNKLQLSLLAAVFPLFEFWSRQARPYAFCGLFMVLGWRWWYMSIIGIVTNPLSVIGIKFLKNKIWVTSVSVIVTLYPI